MSGVEDVDDTLHVKTEDDSVDMKPTDTNYDTEQRQNDTADSDGAVITTETSSTPATVDIACRKTDSLGVGIVKSEAPANANDSPSTSTPHPISGADAGNNPDTPDLSFLATARDQADFERDIDNEAERLLASQSLKREETRLQKAETNRARTVELIATLHEKLSRPGTLSAKAKARTDIETAESRICDLDVEINQIRSRMVSLEQELAGVPDPTSPRNGADGETAEERRFRESGGRLPHETERQFLIRTGKITPFAALDTGATAVDSLSDVIKEAEEENELETFSRPFESGSAAAPVSHQSLKRPGFGAAKSKLRPRQW